MPYTMFFTRAHHVLPRWASSEQYKGIGRPRRSCWHRGVNGLTLFVMASVLAAFVGLGVVLGSTAYTIPQNKSCDTVQHGYVCHTDISHAWGQYSPYFSVPSEISAEIPSKCSVTFAQVLSRHGARDPTASKTLAYNKTVTKLLSGGSNFTGKYAFLADFEYTLGADQLTVFGQQQMVNSGTKFYQRYKALARSVVPFVRSSGESRVVQSAQNWTQGFSNSKISNGASPEHGRFPSVDVVIPETAGTNNTLNHDICNSFENGPGSSIADSAQTTWRSIFVPPIRTRLNTALSINLTDTEVIYIMDLCPFHTVASPTGQLSDFCTLFTKAEWQSYSYYESLNKYYGYGAGNPLGPTQGVGFTNELIARLTDKPVVDHTSTNSTLDADPATFPLGRQLYADFSHDNDMTAIFFALGLYNDTLPLSNTTITSERRAAGYSAAWTVPFAARVYVEKLECEGHREEFVRVLVNDRVVPLNTCGGDEFGRCRLGAFVDSLSFAREGGKWGQCAAV